MHRCQLLTTAQILELPNIGASRAVSQPELHMRLTALARGALQFAAAASPPPAAAASLAKRA